MVSARRKTESLQETPVSVTAFGVDDMNARSIVGLGDLDKFAPNVVIAGAPLSSGASFIASAFIRGIGQGDFLATVDPGVGIYVDDVYLARAQGALLDLSDIERVEVLRGPQGTLFGKNAIGGVVQAISKVPSAERSGSAEISYGRFDRIRARGDFNFPLSDELFVRAAFSVRNSDGYVDRRDLLTGDKKQEQGNEDRWGGRVRVRWAPSDVFEATASVDVAKVRENAAGNYIVTVDDGNGLIGFYNALVADPVPYSSSTILSGSKFVNYNGVSDRDDNRADMDNWGSSLSATWNLGGFSIKSITAYRDLGVEFGRDGDGGPQKMVDNLGTLDQTQFSQELQFSGKTSNDKLSWLAGAYYLSEEAVDVTDVVVASGLYQALESLPAAVIPLAPGVVCPGGPACAGGAANPINVAFDNDYFGINDLRTESYSLFASGTFGITQRLSLTAGARWTHEDKTQVIPIYTRKASGVDTVPRGTRFEASYSAVTPKLSLEYQAWDDVLVYASVGRGFRSGGFNGRTTVPGSLGPFAPEFLWSYELGAKTEWADQRVRLNGAVFLMDYSDIQTVILVNQGVSVAPRTDNAGDAEVKGFELELSAVPARNVRLDASVGYVDAGYTSLGSATEIRLTNKFSHTPKWTFNAGMQASLSVGEFGVLTPRVDLSYRSSHYLDPQNSPGLYQDAYALTNVRLTFEPVRGEWTASIYGTNVSDKAYKTGGLGALNSLGFDEAVVGRPREWGLSIAARF